MCSFWHKCINSWEQAVDKWKNNWASFICVLRTVRHSPHYKPSKWFGSCYFKIKKLHNVAQSSLTVKPKFQLLCKIIWMHHLQPNISPFIIPTYQLCRFFSSYFGAAVYFLFSVHMRKPRFCSCELGRTLCDLWPQSWIPQMSALGSSQLSHSSNLSQLWMCDLCHLSKLHSEEFQLFFQLLLFCWAITTNLYTVISDDEWILVAERCCSTLLWHCFTWIQLDFKS